MSRAFVKKSALAALVLALLSGCAGFHPNNSYPSAAGVTAGETITVNGSENIYTIAHAHNVSMRDLIAINNLRPPFDVHAGESLILPAGGSSFNGGAMPPPAAAPLTPVEKNDLSPIEPAAVSSQSLAPVALPPVQAAPAPQQQPASLAPQSLAPPPVAKPATPAPNPIMTSPAAPVAAATTAAPAGAAVASGDMIWPVQGPILSSFGAKGPGLNNDGINIGAPKGAPVVAAAAGTVVYAGDEMKGFGNLVLIRHQNDWVTAYAHLDRVLVKKDSVVAQGDEIGTVGKTGSVASPQLHFETRQDGKPVDPMGIIKAEN